MTERQSLQNSPAPWAFRYSQDIIENLPVGIYICDQDGIVVAYNRRAAQVWQELPVLGDPEVRFCGAHKILDADGVHIPHHETPMAHVLRTGKAILDVEAIIERRDGSRINVIANIVPLFDEDGKQIGFTNCVQDVTLQKQREQERLDFLNERFQSQKMDTVGQLTAGIAHDFNNMLTAILGTLGLAEHYMAAAKSDLVSKYLRLASLGAKNAASLVSRLTTFSRRRDLAAYDVMLDAIVPPVVELSAHMLGESIKISFSTTPKLSPVRIDPNQFENIMLNLMINARDAMPTGGTITIALRNEIAGGGHEKGELKAGTQCVALTIADSGTGMSSETINRIFEPFFTTKAEGKGTGLGLAMVYGYVLQAGGAIGVQSQEGQGTTFKILLPAVIPDSTSGESLADIEGDH